LDALEAEKCGAGFDQLLLQQVAKNAENEGFPFFGIG
jgi:hypothetical protein